VCSGTNLQTARQIDGQLRANLERGDMLKVTIPSKMRAKRLDEVVWSVFQSGLDRNGGP
jgi:hypothetical protein